jgi:hypothetical protein
MDYPDYESQCALEVAECQAQTRYIEFEKTLTPEEKAKPYLTQKELKFRTAELSRLAAVEDLQTKLAKYRQEVKNKKPLELASEAQRSDSSTKLGSHLMAVGQFRQNVYWHAHHIVCAKHKSHGSARLILFMNGIGINDPHNGCWLPQKHKHARGTKHPEAVGHAYIHTNEYAALVLDRLRGKKGSTAVFAALNNVRLNLHDARSLPPNVLTEKGKEDLRNKI